MINFIPKTTDEKIRAYFKLLCVFILILRFPNFNLFGQFWDMSQWTPIGMFKLLPTPVDKGIMPAILVGVIISFTLSLWGWGLNFLSKICFVFGGLYLGFGNNYGSVSHGYQLFVMTLGIMALTNLEGVRPSPFKNFYILRPEAGVKLIKLYVVYVWTLTGLQKLANSGLEWTSSSSFSNIVFLTPGTRWMADFLINQAPWVFGIFATSALLIELFAGLSLTSKKAALLFPFAWMAFHFSVTALMGLHTAFWSSIPVYWVFWLFPAPLIQLKQPLKSTN